MSGHGGAPGPVSGMQPQGLRRPNAAQPCCGVMPLLMRHMASRSAWVQSAADMSTYANPVLNLYNLSIQLYDTGMATMNISAARDRLPEAVELARTEAVFLERYGRPAAVLVSPEQYEKFVAALEEADDVAAFDAAMAEEGPNIPWDQVKADLGWT